MVAREARGIAERIVGISDTTRRQFAETMRRAIGEGLTVTETARRLVEEFPGMSVKTARAADGRRCS